MKRIIILVLVAILASACSALQSGQAPAPSVDIQATVDARVRQSVAETQAAQPSPTTVPPTDTPTSVVASSPTATVDAPSSTPVPNLTTTPATATLGTENPTFTATQPVSGEPTLTPTLGILTWGTLPPAVPYTSITIINKSKLQAYISLQNDPPQQVAIMEYPVKKQISIDAPIGYYIYVVWVGGRKITGDFMLHHDEALTITIYKDQVTIK